MGALSGSDKRNVKQGGRKYHRAVLVAFLLFVLTVFLYLIRLEAHTGADIFLPADYHSVLRNSGSEGGAPVPSGDDALNAYYEAYARQEGRPYTIRQDLLLSRLAYIKAPQGFRGEIEGVTLQALCDEVKRMVAGTAMDAERTLGRSREEILAITTGIGEHGLLGRLVIREYITNASGFAGYVLENDGEITMALRGTEDAIDTLDNMLLLPFNLSVQYADIRDLLGKYGDAKHVWLTGHSKGGHNAIYAASIDARCHATGFNAPGFGIFLSDAQHDGLDRGVNYVINGDVTGFLLFHLERRVVLESTGSALPNKHRLDNFFSVDDLTVAARIQPFSIGCEWSTQILWLFLLFLAGYGMIMLLKRIWQGIRPRKSSIGASPRRKSP